MSKPKWMYTENVSCRIYNRHPDTGSREFQGAYVYVDSNHTKQSIIKLFTKHDWIYLRDERHWILFYKEQGGSK